MDPPVATFHLGLGIGVIGPAFYTRYLGPYITITSFDFY